MVDGYEQEDTDVIVNNKNVKSSPTPTAEQIYTQLGCEALE